MCPRCIEIGQELSRIEDEIAFLAELITTLKPNSEERREAVKRLGIVEGDVNRTENAYFTHRSLSLQHALEDQALLN